jgi:SAM-dependent methyltransferase
VACWTRAIAALPVGQGRVLDVDCAFGYSTRLLRRRGYAAVGVDASPSSIARIAPTQAEGISCAMPRMSRWRIAASTASCRNAGAHGAA